MDVNAATQHSIDECFERSKSQKTQPLEVNQRGEGTVTVSESREGMEGVNGGGEEVSGVGEGMEGVNGGGKQQEGVSRGGEGMEGVNGVGKEVSEGEEGQEGVIEVGTLGRKSMMVVELLRVREQFHVAL